jgi:hypothetical protein
MKPFGRVENVDIKRRAEHNDAFAFVVYEELQVKGIRTKRYL